MDMGDQQNAVCVQEAAPSAASLREQVSSVSGAVSAFKTTGREVIDVSAKQIMASAKRPAVANTPAAGRPRASAAALVGHRSEERRVGKECVSTCRSRWAPYP